MVELTMNGILDIVTANFSLADAQSTLVPLLTFVAGMAVYCIFVFRVYSFLGRRDIFALDLEKYVGERWEAFKKFGESVRYVIKYALIFPVFTFSWFLMFTALIVFLSKTESIETVLLMAMALVATIRISAYHAQELSLDIGKIIPFALLAIFLVDISYFSLESSLQALLSIPLFWKTIVYYLAFTIVLEFVLRVVHTLTRKASGE